MVIVEPETIEEFEEMQKEQGTKAALQSLLEAVEEAYLSIQKPSGWNTFTGCACPHCRSDAWN